jgi:hypothetical protein
MTTAIRDLWPPEIALEDVISPEEILTYQANLLAEKTSGRLVGHVERLVISDRVVLAFEVEAPVAGNRVRLFEAQHRLEFEYPVKVIPPDSLPEFLRQYASIRSASSLVREWIAATPTEFSNQIKDVLDAASTKSLILSLLSRSKRNGESNDQAT